MNRSLSKKSIDELDDILQPDNQQKKTELDVLKELFLLDDVESKTELSIQQIIKFNQKRTIAKLLQWDSLDNCLNDFMLLMISKDRKGRAEFVQGLAGEREHSIKMSQGGFMNSFKQRLGWQ